jgi:ATP-binding cassette subfamily B (MDR/TAP) protein 1
LSKAQAAANRMLFIIDKKPVINSAKGVDPRHAPEAKLILELRDVHFIYPNRPEVEVLCGISFGVKMGENICIVGPSGCGKSTIISLLERFYDTTQGQILIDGNNISSLDIKSYRSMLGLVSQETILYQGTIRENLLLGVDETQINDQQLSEACHTANIYDFITSLPEGFETDCGHRGLELSGGQQQRIAIARTLLRNPKILLLDEATSALDSENEMLVRTAIEKAAHGRTTISVTHSREVMKAADRIIVLEKGGIVVEEGTFQELMENNGPFWRLMVEEDSP